MTIWNNFYKEKITKIFTESNNVLDIGGGLRINKEKNNRYEKKNEWIIPLAKKVDYKILDPVPDYNPDIVGDIHDLPFDDNSQDSIICNAVLEHVENPIKASQEMYRVLKPKGYCFVYVPFLYYYHAEKGYYGDFWRFTEDSINYMFKDFSSIEIQRLHGATETWIKLSPLGRFSVFLFFARLIDVVSKKTKSNQTSGFFVFLTK
ncbi:class I SAM-dependent methyltransferase [candidate division KSB1 bacterium]